MKKYEKVALMLMVLGIAVAMLLTMSSNAGELSSALLWPGAALALVLLVSAIVVVKVGWERDTSEKAVLFFDLGKEVRK
mgnify:CR=1 FL=1